MSMHTRNYATRINFLINVIPRYYFKPNVSLVLKTRCSKNRVDCTPQMPELKVPHTLHLTQGKKSKESSYR